MRFVVLFSDMKWYTKWRRDRSVAKVTELGPQIVSIECLLQAISNSPYRDDDDAEWLTNRLISLTRQRDRHLDYIRKTAEEA